jgi:hypothetical protein
MENKRAIVKKDNAFVESARYRLSVKEQRVVLTLISRIHPEDADFKDYVFKVSDLFELLGFKKESLIVKKRGLEKILKNLKSKNIRIVTRAKPGHAGREVVMFPSWIVEPFIDYEADSITLRVSDLLKPYLLNLQEKFTRYPLSEIAHFRCAYSFRFLEFCKNHEPREDRYDLISGGRYVKIQVYAVMELRRLLDIPEELYPKFHNFKIRVLDATQKEINGRTQSYFEYELVKDSEDRRRTKAVKLLIYGPFSLELLGVCYVWPCLYCERKSSPPPRALPENSSQPDNGLRRRMLSLGVSERLADVILQSKYDYRPIRIAIEAVENYAGRHKLRWPDRVLNRSLLEGWMSPKEEAKQAMARKNQEKIQAKEDSENLRIRLEQHEEQQAREREEKLDQDQERMLKEYDEQLEGYRNAYQEREDKLSYVLGLWDAFDALDEEQRGKISEAAGKMIQDGAEFDEVYDLAGRLIVGSCIPVENI